MNRYIHPETGKVAVLYSPGYGAGWSTWADSEAQEFCAMDAGLVERHINGTDIEDVEAYIKEQMPDAYVYFGGNWSQLKIAWLEPGTLFDIDEYDGFESVRTLETLCMRA